jgi:glycosyltransferase involved in cell wall biosynthesis
MIKKSIIYYTHPYFLDSCIETIQSIKNEYEINLIIELSQDSKKSTIINIENIESLSDIVNFKDVVSDEIWNKFSIYFEGIKSVKFVVFKNKKTLSLTSIKTGIILWKYINKIDFLIIHFDTLSNKAISTIPLLFFKNVFATIHDPVSHTGEESVKRNVIFRIYKLFTKGYFFYSKYSKSQFEKINYKTKNKNYKITLQPYSFISQFKKNSVKLNKYILFFGRISYYKGIDIYIRSIKSVLDKYPNEVFVIAGKGENIEVNELTKSEYRKNIILIDKYVDIEELAKIIQDSKFIVCPYREATQSGVLMTAKSMGKMVIASNVGAFPEYIKNGFDGILVDINKNKLTEEIIRTIENGLYSKLEKNIESSYSEKIGNENKREIMRAYSNCM